MTGLVAGYISAITALLVAGSVALTIIHHIGRLDTIDDQAPREQPAGKLAA